MLYGCSSLVLPLSRSALHGAFTQQLAVPRVVPDLSSVSIDAQHTHWLAVFLKVQRIVPGESQGIRRQFGARELQVQELLSVGPRLHEAYARRHAPWSPHAHHTHHALTAHHAVLVVPHHVRSRLRGHSA